MVFEKVKQVLMDQLGIDGDQITEQTDIVEDLGADSLDEEEMVMTLEEEFELVINDESIQDFKTVGDVVAFIEDNI